MSALKRRRTIRDFLVIGFTLGITTTAALSALMGLLLFRSQLSSTAALIQQRVESAITLNRNEILNEIALKDFDAIREHLGILRLDLNLDKIILRCGSIQVTSESETPGFHRAIRAFVPKDALKPLRIPLANDYGGFKAEIEAYYHDEVVRRVIRPVLLPFAATLFCLLLVECLSFFATFQLINYKVIRPIQDLASSFKIAASSKNGQGAPLALDPQEGRLIELEDLNESLRSYSELRESAVAGELARQVAHDIRSPLAALEVVSGDVARLPDDKRALIQSAVGRIRDIANSLLDRTRRPAPGDPEALSGHLLSALIEPILSEKRLQFRSNAGVDISAVPSQRDYGLSARLDPVEFRRLLSNLINNAVESLDSGSGAVRVDHFARDGRVVVTVEDTGRGIAPEVLLRLGRRGETHGKAGGSGLGLHHARACAEAWGGTVEIRSEIGKGTAVSVTLTRTPPPAWFVPELALTAGRPIVILDDEASIHQIWRHRLNADPRGRLMEIVDLSTAEDLRGWVKANAAKAREAVFLLDYELAGCLETGLALAQELGVVDRAILVTSRHDEPAIREDCRRLGLRAVPKEMARLIPIRIQGASAAEGPERVRWDAILIDDDGLARATWKIAAARLQKRFRSYSTVGEFLAEADAVHRETPIYIDADLGGGVEGDVEALKLHALGFDEIYLATGHEARRFAGLAHLRGVVGKEPPWSGQA